MSNARDMTKVLDAWRAGKPFPKGSTILTPQAPQNQVAFVAFVRMGGESVPWGMAIKPANGRVPTKCFVVPDPRKRTDLALTLRKFGKFLCKWLEQDTSGKDWPHPQIWLPNPAHLEMLHGLALRYVWTRFTPEGMSDKHAEELRQMGRAANWLFFESQHPGQTAVVTATDALKACHYFPADNLRQAHLGFLLAWLENQGSRRERQLAATIAEQESISPTLNPSVESGGLEKLVLKFGDKSTPEDVKNSCAEKIISTIESELTRRINLIEKAYLILNNDERAINPGFHELAEETRTRMNNDFLQNEIRARSGESIFVPNPDTDGNPRKAAEIFMEREKSGSGAKSKLLKYDSELQGIAISSGDAVSAVVTNIDHKKEGRKNIISWTIESDGNFPLRLRIGDRVSVNSLSENVLTIQNIDTVKNRREITLLVNSPKTARGGLDMAAASRLGSELLFIKHEISIPLFRKFRNLRSKDARGSWVGEEILKQRKKNA